MLTKCFLNQTTYAESRCQKTNAKLIPYAKTHMLKKCKHDLSSNQHTERVMKYKKTKEKSQSQSQSSAPKQFETNEFQNGTFLRPSSYYKYSGCNLQHSVVNNNGTQSRNSRAVALSTHARLRFNSSMSSLLGAFDFPHS